MSWDLICFEFPDPKKDPETGEAILPDWGEDGPPVIGSGHELRARISEVLGEIDWRENGADIELQEGSIELYLHADDEPVSHFMLFCWGRPIEAISLLAREGGFNIYDLSSGFWIEDVRSASVGNESYHDFRDKTLRDTNLKKVERKSLFARLFGKRSD